ncbi:MAG: DUF5703 domain-containing protein [Planctomycetaceae bacterium]|jgi:hypothetical protein|nr:DUF5703 domain-containing protein [Planctomycetaceae bacterium]
MKTKIRTLNRFVTILLLSMLAMLLTLTFCTTIIADEPPLYELVWDTPSKNVHETVPLGNGEVAVNAWIDKTGNLRFYIARIDSIDENGQLLKIGALKISPQNSISTQTAFKQTLDVKHSILETVYGDVSYKLWIDANQNIIVAEITTKTPQIVTAYNDGWRNKQTKRNQYECSDLYNVCPYENKSFREVFREHFDNLETIIEPDTILNLPDVIGWYHRNIHSKPYQLTAEVQGTDDFPRQDPLLHRTFGAIVQTEHGKKIDNKTLQSPEGTIHRFEIAVHTKHPATETEWLHETEQILNNTQKISLQDRFAKHEKWWNNFWNRSWIHFTKSEKNETNIAQPSSTSNDPIPKNEYRVVFGKDQHGGSQFLGTLQNCSAKKGVLSNEQIQQLVNNSLANDKSTSTFFADNEYPDGLTVTARINPSKLGNYQRIADKITPGKTDGFLVDITPDGKLRVIVGSQQITTPTSVITANRLTFVTVTVSSNADIKIFVDGNLVNASSSQSDKTFDGLSDQFILSRAYMLQRYVSACAGRGKLAIKFNGSIFTVPAQGKEGDADYRRWGPGYWWQNTRLPYFSMPAAGDFEMMQPLFNQYFEILPLCKKRVKKYFGHDGAYYPECIYFWGDVFLETYGWETWKERKDKLQKSGYHKYEWVGGLEIAHMMLEYYEYTEDINFLYKKAIPLTIEILTFFNEHYKTNTNGKLFMSPAQALETWWDCDNPTPELAGIYGVIEQLERLPDHLLTAETKQFVSELKQKLPELPLTQSPDNKIKLAPAQRFKQKNNIEIPELYAVFPFRLISYEKPNVEWGIEAYKHRSDRGSFGWRQDDLFASYLRLTNEAVNNLVMRAKNKHKESRFPVFWGPNYDWIPDQDHGGVLTKGVQSLVMQCDGKRIDLFPTLPTGWDCEFKLNAPHKTTIEGQLKNGKLVNLKVTPKEREKDIHILTPYSR